MNDNKYNSPKRINNNLYIIVFIIMFLSGLSVMLYPVISNYINTNMYNKNINEYTYKVSNTNSDIKEDILNKAYLYNSNLKETSIQDIFSTDINIKDNEYDNVLNVDGRGLMGYISIPKINVKIPIYHSTYEDVLNKGVGHLKGSSLPVGGIGTHSILAAHRGLPTSKLFTDLDSLKSGDKFYIYILDEVLAYEVDNISVVKPNDLSMLEIDENNDYVTLVTCTPYGINTHRLLVRGKRIEENNNVDKDIKVSVSKDTKLLYISFIIIILITIICKKKIKKENNLKK